MVTRRKFIQLGSLASASLMVPQFVKGFDSISAPGNGSKILVIVQLTGGNDPLNTLIPYRNDVYYRVRPHINIASTDVLKLTDEAGLHPQLKQLKQIYDDGKLCIVNGVGYEHPNRSHFRSMDIWQTGSNADELVSTGWLGRYIDMAPEKVNKHNSVVVEVDDSLTMALRGARSSAIAIENVEQFYNIAGGEYFKKLASHQDEHAAKLPAYLYKTLREATSSADYLYAQSKVYSNKASYPETSFGQRMKTIGSLIMSNAETKVYYISHGSFDTHASQKDRQQILLGQLDAALGALVADLKLNKRFDDVLIMTFSEFGRRVSQNASNGTDHGAAGNMFFIGGSLKKPGIFNQMPSLTDLDDGDLKHSIDFKNIYATILDNWLDVKSSAILGRNYDRLGII